MPFYEGEARIDYEEACTGFPLLMIPGGGLNATIAYVTGSAPRRHKPPPRAGVRRPTTRRYLEALG